MNISLWETIADMDLSSTDGIDAVIRIVYRHFLRETSVGAARMVGRATVMEDRADDDNLSALLDLWDCSLVEFDFDNLMSGLRNL